MHISCQLYEKRFSDLTNMRCALRYKGRYKGFQKNVSHLRNVKLHEARMCASSSEGNAVVVFAASAA
jgi:hypothetical protein